MTRYSKPRFCLIHPMDPRGAKFGGIETHVRNFLKYYPDDVDLLFIGVDEIGDLHLGELSQISYMNRKILFLPLIFIPTDTLNKAGKTLKQSTTLLFALALLKHYFLVRRLLKQTAVSIELQRYEFSPFVRSLGYAPIQWVHGEGAPDQKMDSLLKKYWFTHRINEYLAIHFADYVFCVNQAVKHRLQQLFPAHSDKYEVMSVAIDTQLFTSKPFDLTTDVLRICFAGRLDEFKDPPLMFRVLDKLHHALNGNLEFHYVGASDPERYSEYSLIESFTIRHGLQTSQGVAHIAALCHCGILTSYFEGLPCYLLEMLATGRPVCAIRLPQYDTLIKSGLSGYLVERTKEIEISEAALVSAFLKIWNEIKMNTIDPHSISQLVEDYSLTKQMTRLFERHLSRLTSV